MTTDSLRPITFRVTIDGSGYTSNTGDETGFIDPVKTVEYMAMTGKQSTITPTASDGDTVKVNGVSITFTTDGGLTVSGIVATINELTHAHHVVASVADTDKLLLVNEAMYEGNAISVTGEDSVLTALGFNPPSDIAAPTEPTSKATSLSKERGNIRWKLLVDNVSYNSTPRFIGAIVQEDATIDAAAEEFEFTVQFAVDGHVWTHDELNDGAVIEGIPALKRMVARTLVQTKSENRAYVDPTNDSNGGTGKTIARKLSVEYVTAAALEDDLVDAEALVTVETIPSVG